MSRWASGSRARASNLNLVGHHPVRARGALLVEHEVHPVALGLHDRQGVVEVVLFQESLPLLGREEDGVQAQRILGVERLLAEEGDDAVLPDERAPSGAQVEVARLEAHGGSEELLQGGGERGVVHLADGFERERRRRARPLGLAGHEHQGLHELACGNERVPLRRAAFRPGRREAGELLKRVDLGDDLGVDQLLREFEQVRPAPELRAHLDALHAREDSLLDAELDEPEQVAVQRGRSHGRQSCRRTNPCQARIRGPRRPGCAAANIYLPFCRGHFSCSCAGRGPGIHRRAGVLPLRRDRSAPPGRPDSPGQPDNKNADMNRRETLRLDGRTLPWR